MERRRGTRHEAVELANVTSLASSIALAHQLLYKDYLLGISYQPSDLPTTTDERATLTVITCVEDLPSYKGAHDAQVRLTRARQLSCAGLTDR